MQHSVLIVDDHALIREGVTSLLDSEQFKVIGEAGDGDVAIEKYNELKNQVKKMEDDQKRTKRMQEQFNQDIEELGEEADSLVEEIEKWQI